MVADPWSGNRRESNRDNVLDRKPDSLFRGVKVSSAIVKDTDLGLFVTLSKELKDALAIGWHKLTTMEEVISAASLAFQNLKTRDNLRHRFNSFT